MEAVLVSFSFFACLYKAHFPYITQGAAVAGQNNTYIPHKGVLSPAENTLYVSYR